jgi:hypothetical protein
MGRAVEQMMHQRSSRHEYHNSGNETNAHQNCERSANVMLNIVDARAWQQFSEVLHQAGVDT